MRAADLRKCRHCGSPVSAEAGAALFCCHGCEAVHGLLVEHGLERYYDLAGSQVMAPPAPAAAPQSHSWLEPLVEAAERAEGGAAGRLCTLEVDVQGIHCAACVWLMNETFRRHSGGADVTVNPALGKVRMVWQKGAFAPRDWIQEVEAFGYQFGPSRKQATKSSIELPLRLGVSAALTVNVMLFSLSFYFGLNTQRGQSDTAVFQLFTWLSLALSTAVVVIGGWPFFRAALRSLRSGVLHLDLPIAVGIGLVYGASLMQMRHGRGDVTYFDTLNIFICLMLVGRLLQERVLERNRRFLLEDDGAEGLFVRVVRGEHVAVVRAPQVRAGERLLIAPGDLVPVAAALLDERAEIRTDWITGEAAPLACGRGAEIPAGSFNAGRGAFEAVAKTDFAASPLVALLRQPAPRQRRGASHQRLWNDVARLWVGAVLALAGIGFALWLHRGFDTAINVAAALLVVTCPCALGIAVPLAYELTQARLRRAGFFVRADDLLDRLARVRKLLFDKTGTLTLGRLELVEPAVLDRLTDAERAVAYNLAVRSGHPASACVAAALLGSGARYDPAARTAERPGYGIEWQRPDGLWRLGRGDWAAIGSGRDMALARDGEVLAVLAVREAMRPDARRQFDALRAAGYETWLFSGDAVERVQALAETLAIPPAQARGRLLPAEKASAVAALDREDTLYLGDGVNDALAFERAYAAGTPAIDRPVMPGRSDFFLVGDGLAPLAEALAASRRLQRVVRGLLISSAVYNACAVALCLAGRMSPLLAAILMPASTLFLLSRTAWSLSDRAPRAAWVAPVTPAALPVEIQP